MIRVVIFDLGGVLVPWSNSVTYRFIEGEYGVPYKTAKRELEKRLPLVQRGLLSEKDWMADFFHSQNIEPLKGYEDIWGKTFEGSTYNTDAERVVRELKENGYKLAVLSNIEPSRAAYLRRHGLTNDFDEVIFSSEVGLRKPDRNAAEPNGTIFEYTLKRLELPASECLYVDDDENCLKGAEKAGISGILFKGPESLRKELAGYGLLNQPTAWTSISRG